MNIQGYDVTASNGSKKQRASVFVKQNGVVLAQVYSCHSGPLKRIRTYPQCEERRQLIDQLKSNDVPMDDIKAILAMPTKDAK